jgi:nitrite reductase/ring-hydroxylating ferredoxin subunit
MRGKLFLLWGLAAVALLVVGGIIVARMFQSSLTDQIRLGSAADFPIGSMTLFDCDRTAARCTLLRDATTLVGNMKFRDVYPSEYQEAWIWLTHESPDTWKAFLAISPHHGCFVNWFPDKARFEEGCYGSKWMPNGKYQEGPSPRGLDSFPVRVQGDDVWIDFKLTRGALIPQ